MPFKVLLLLLMFFCQTLFAVHASDLVNTVKKVKPSVVAIALYTPIESNVAAVRGTGFVFGNGRYVATNYHVVAETLNPNIVQYYVALAGSGKRPEPIKAEVIAFDVVADLAILRINKALPALSLAEDSFVDDATQVAFTGFPIGSILGLYPSTHRGIIAALTPDAIPSNTSQQLSNTMLNRLQNPLFIYQLDATAYPGNSGSPMYLQETGQVVGILNKVFVAAGKESAISTPTGISYAIPVKHLRRLAKKHNINV